MDIVDVLLEHGATYDTNDTVCIGEIIVSFVVADTVAEDDDDDHDDDNDDDDHGDDDDHDDCYDDEVVGRWWSMI